VAWETELAFLGKILPKFHLSLRTFRLSDLGEVDADFGLRRFLGLEGDHRRDMYNMIAQRKERTLYLLTDAFSCHYIMLLLPGDEERGLLVGPYLTEIISREKLKRDGERLGVPLWLHRRMEEYYGNLPALTDDSFLQKIFTAFAETIWGSDYEIVDIRQQREEQQQFVFPSQKERETERVIMDMQLLERRYAFENELMEIVSRGQYHRAELMMRSFGELSFEERTKDTLRNIKNYCIICNTLMRKAAQQGGVHPLYLDEISSDFASRIENVRRTEDARNLIPDMARDYCRLVRKHTAENYSPIVRKAVLLIESDLTRNLSLSAVSDVLNISPGYLSGLFHQETGKTLTEFVNEKRLEMGARLLRNGSQQIQTVAQYCGIPDVNYFTKLFKKHYGVTPREYRKSGQ